MPKKLYTSIPKNYPVASIVTAPCLRHLPYTALLENEEYLPQEMQQGRNLQILSG